MPTTAKGTPYVVSTDLVANYPTVSSDLADHIDDNVAYNAVSINAQTGTTYTFALADASEGKLVTASNAAAATYTVPPQSSVTWADGAVLRILNQGAGVVTIAAGAGVTINGNPKTLSQYKSATIYRTASNTWTLIQEGESSKILQIVRATDGTSRSTTSTSMVDASISVTITPQKSDSNILLIWSRRPLNNNEKYLFSQITDSSNNAISGAENTSLGQDVLNTYLSVSNAVIAWASPATVSAVTYKGRFRSSNGGSVTLQNADQTGQLFAIEVAA